MKVLVCGSRDWKNYGAIADRLGALIGQDVTVIHGAARGADEIAGEVASFYEFNVQEFPADWDTHGKRAGILRNLEMLDQHPDMVIAFRSNGSRGTTHTIEAARRRGIPVEVHEA